MIDGSHPRISKDRERPAFPQRAVVTAGMPYGNKDLHFGHIGGVFIHADFYARFLRDRLGSDRVLFVSGTDCYGSPIVEDHRKQVEAGTFSGTLLELAELNHERQRQTLDSYGIDLEAYAASALDPWVDVHCALGAWILETLHANGHVERRATRQFYDPQVEQFLNGRQVLGQCPIAGCNSDKAYADECSLGHQFEPSQLLEPRSQLTGKRPEMREVANWYVPTERFRDVLRPWYERRLETGDWRAVTVRTLLEYFEPPTIHVVRKHLKAIDAVADRLPAHTREAGRAKSERLIFASLEDLDAATSVLAEIEVPYRTGKALAPFRLTGNLEWGLPAPALDGLDGLTFWVWPESLWAPISFVSAALQQRGEDAEAWRTWWCSKDAGVYQFIGEDNVFYYGLAQMAMFLGLQSGDAVTDAPAGQLRLTKIISNRHLLFLDKKASSSGAVKPPMARDLLDHYTAEQLRMHFLSLALGMRNANFRPKPLNPGAPENEGDPVLKDGNVLSNALNRAVRSCFYTAQKYFDRRLPAGEVSHEVAAAAEETILDFEAAVQRQEFHVAMEIAGAHIRGINSRWSSANPYKEECDDAVRAQALIDGFHGVRVAVTLLHPVAPFGTEKVREYLRVGEALWSWDRIFAPLSELIENPAEHRLLEVPPRVDFFDKHPSQLRDDA